ncbi:MAG: DNA-methyltransferase [Acidimicrobiales bacterium]
MTPFYVDDTTTLYCADVRDPTLTDALDATAAAVVTSPPYNVGLDYDGDSGGDSLPWPEYWQLAAAASDLMASALVPGGRAWVNTAVSVPHDQAAGKCRVLLAHRWATALEAAGLGLVDQVAWCSPRGAGTAWGSWESPAGPNLRGDYEAVTVACRDGWERTAPAGHAGWRDRMGGWPGLCSTVWNLTPAARERGGHPAPFPVELARRCIRLSTWPGEVVVDPFAGTGTTLVAARQLGRRAIGVERSEAYCLAAVDRLAQLAFDFAGAA